MDDLNRPDDAPEHTAQLLVDEPAHERVWRLPSGIELRLCDVKALARAFLSEKAETNRMIERYQDLCASILQVVENS